MPTKSQHISSEMHGYFLTVSTLILLGLMTLSFFIDLFDPWYYRTLLFRLTPRYWPDWFSVQLWFVTAIMFCDTLLCEEFGRFEVISHKYRTAVIHWRPLLRNIILFVGICAIWGVATDSVLSLFAPTDDLFLAFLYGIDFIKYGEFLVEKNINQRMVFWNWQCLSTVLAVLCVVIAVTTVQKQTHHEKTDVATTPKRRFSELVHVIFRRCERSVVFTFVFFYAAACTTLMIYRFSEFFIVYLYRDPMTEFMVNGSFSMRLLIIPMGAIITVIYLLRIKRQKMSEKTR